MYFVYNNMGNILLILYPFITSKYLKITIYYLYGYTCIGKAGQISYCYDSFCGDSLLGNG